MKKILSAILTIIILMSVLVSCFDNPNENSTTSTKGDHWNDEIKAAAVVCSDGTVELE